MPYTPLSHSRTTGANIGHRTPRLPQQPLKACCGYSSFIGSRFQEQKNGWNTHKIYGREWSGVMTPMLGSVIIHFQGVKWLVKLVVICHFKTKFGLVSELNGNSHQVTHKILVLMEHSHLYYSSPVGWKVIMSMCPLKNYPVLTCKQGEELIILPKWFTSSLVPHTMCFSLNHFP